MAPVIGGRNRMFYPCQIGTPRTAAAKLQPCLIPPMGQLRETIKALSDLTHFPFNIL